MPFDQAATLSGITDPVAALDETTRAGILLPGEGRGLSTLRFPSALVRAAVHSAITPLRRQELHRAATEIVHTERERLAHRVGLSPFPDAALAAELDAFADRRAAQGEWAVARARVSFAYGQTLRRAGKRREADLLLQQARDAFHALGARSYVRRCDRELKAGGLHTKRATDLTGLTAQERAVAGLVAAGMTNKQAATELYVSVKTVQFHLTRIYAKLAIASRSELAARFRTED